MPKEKRAVTFVLRAWFHSRLRAPVKEKRLYCYATKLRKSSELIVPTNADKDSSISVRIADGVAKRLRVKRGDPMEGQPAGAFFERQVRRFLDSMLRHLSGKEGVRPGIFEVRQVPRQDRLALARYEQYAHLKVVQDHKDKSNELAAALGSDYLVSSDVVVERASPSDADIDAGSVTIAVNKSGQEVRRRVVDENFAKRTRLRRQNIADTPLLHATVSCKWTLRSDRSQNVRVESQNVSRNRKGNQPHIVVVTAECLPSRLVSVALSTGDIDSVYHFALDELIVSVNELATGAKTAYETAFAKHEELLTDAKSTSTIERQNKMKSLRAKLRGQQPVVEGGNDPRRDDIALLAQLAEEESTRIAELRLAEKTLAARKRDWEPLGYENEQLAMLVNGKRLKDISDLPFDLMV
jgi:hypothetical protein